MIIFYNKKTGEVFGTVDGRVHGREELSVKINNGIPEEDVGRMIIGWEDTGKTVVETEEKERYEAVEDTEFYKKVRYRSKIEKPVRKECNLDCFDLLKKFENLKENPLNYEVKKNKLTKIKKKLINKKKL